MNSIPSRYVAHVELLHDDQLQGWVIDRERIGRPTWIEIGIDGRRFASVIAGDTVDIRHLDVKDWPPEFTAYFRERPQIPAGFCYRVPTSIPRGIGTHTISVTVAEGAERTDIFTAVTNLAEGKDRRDSRAFR